MSRIRVLIADDHDVTRSIVMDLLRPEFDIVGAVRDGQELISAAKSLKPDVIVTDFSMPQMDGLTAAGLIIKDNPDARIVLLTIHSDPEIVRRCLEAGLLGYVLKTDAEDKLSQAIHDVSQGKRFVSGGIK